MLKHGILGLLNYGSMTGYEIRDTFRDSLNYFWTAQTSQIYRELQTLKSRGWVLEGYVPQSGKPDKKPFTITEEGQEELLHWLKDSSTELTTNSPLLMKTFFLGELPKEEQLAFFERLIAESRSFLSGIEQIEEKLNSYGEDVPDAQSAVYWRMTLEYGVMQAEMAIRWAEKCIEEIKGADA